MDRADPKIPPQRWNDGDNESRKRRNRCVATKKKKEKIRRKRRMKEGRRSWLTPPLSSTRRDPPRSKDNCINLFPIRRRNSRSFGLITLLNDPAPPSSSRITSLSIKFLGERRRTTTSLPPSTGSSTFVPSCHC